MYEIKVLKNEEFDSLPSHITRGENISDSLGFADRENRKAYIRDTGIHEANKLLVNHEIGELVEGNPSHRGPQGLYHKKWYEIFNPTSWFGGSEEPQTASIGEIGQNFASFIPQATSTSPSAMSPFSAFGQSNATGSLPSSAEGTTQPRLTGGNLSGAAPALSQDELQRKKGFFGGRLTF